PRHGTVRRVRVVEMQPAEESGIAYSSKPGKRLVGYLIGRAPQSGVRSVRPAARRKIVTVDVETLIEAAARLQHVSSDEGTGLIAALFEDFGQRRFLRVQHEIVVADAVMERKA